MNRDSWTLERYQAQLESVLNDIREMNKEINSINGKIAELQYKRKAVSHRISKKTKYKNLLESHIKNDFWT